MINGYFLKNHSNIRDRSQKEIKSTQIPMSLTLADPQKNHISFAEIVKGRNADVKLTSDNLMYAVDLAKVMSGKNNNDAGKDLRDLDEDLFPQVQ